MNKKALRNELELIDVYMKWLCSFELFCKYDENMTYEYLNIKRKMIRNELKN